MAKSFKWQVFILILGFSLFSKSKGLLASCSIEAHSQKIAAYNLEVKLLETYKWIVAKKIPDLEKQRTAIKKACSMAEVHLFIDELKDSLPHKSKQTSAYKKTLAVLTDQMFTLSTTTTWRVFSSQLLKDFNEKIAKKITKTIQKKTDQIDSMLKCQLEKFSPDFGT